MRLNIGTFLVLGLALAFAAALGWQRWLTTAELAELERLRAAHRELLWVQAEHDRLAAQQVSPDQQDAWRADGAAATALRAEVEATRRKLDEGTQAAAEKVVGFERFPVDIIVPAAEWRNAGGGTPAAALETVLWAAAGGDVGVFARRLRFFAGAQNAARALMEELPPSVRAQVRTPEEAIAFLSIKDVPLGSIKVRHWTESNGPYQQVFVQLARPDGAVKESNLVFVRYDGDWKLMVTEPVVARYAALVKAAASGP